MSKQNTCGQCEYYDQRTDGKFCKNQHNMMLAHREIRILDTTEACYNFEPRLPANHNARLLFLAEKHDEDVLIKAAVSNIKTNMTQLQGALQQSNNIISKFESMSEMEPGYVFGGLSPVSFSCFSELNLYYQNIREWFYVLSERLEALEEDVSFF
jgi:hypothetical protein